MMIYDHILIRYGELGLKGKNIHIFIQQLERNIKAALVSFPNIQIKRPRGRMFIVLNGEDHEQIIKKCKRIFGIYSMSLAMKVDNDLSAIKAGALKALNNTEDSRTFKVNVRRANKQFPIQSQEMNRRVGSHLLKNSSGYSVDVHKPDVEVRIEIREKATYIYSEIIPGAGGLPVGTGGKTLLLLSGGIDSPVAGYLMMKRGVQLEMIHFHSPPFTSDRAKQKVYDLTEVLTTYGGKIKVHLVPFTNIQQKIVAKIPERYHMTIMRRLMVSIADRLSEELKILSLTTGESLGQVASQTMESMHVINEVTTMPVLRPLVAYDKEEIVNISRQIDTYDISIRPYEDCCTIFVPKAPATNPQLEKVLAIEEGIDFSKDVEEALEQTEIRTFSPAESVDDTFSQLL